MAGTCGYGEGLSGSINAGNFLTSCKVLLVRFSRRTLLHGVSKMWTTYPLAVILSGWVFEFLRVVYEKKKYSNRK